MKSLSSLRLSLAASTVGRFLKTSGISKYMEQTGTVIKSYWSAVHKAIKDSSPEYYKAVVDTCTPYVKLAGDVFLILKNRLIRLYYNSAGYFEKNVPVLLDSVNELSNTFCVIYLLYKTVIYIYFFYV